MKQALDARTAVFTTCLEDKILHTNPIIRRSTRLLAAVHELHKQGYQGLAIHTSMAPGFTPLRQTLPAYDWTYPVASSLY